MPRKKKVTDKPMVLAAQELVAKAGTNIYDGRQMIPADNVDADGKAWPTVGENIRQGTKDVGIEMAEKMYSAILGKKMHIVPVICDMSEDIIKTNSIQVNGGDVFVQPVADFFLIGALSTTSTNTATIDLIRISGVDNVAIRLRTSPSQHNSPVVLYLALSLE